MSKDVYLHRLWTDLPGWISMQESQTVAHNGAANGSRTHAIDLEGRCTSRYTTAAYKPGLLSLIATAYAMEPGITRKKRGKARIGGMRPYKRASE